ncbi:MAG TPA: SH3 domain-containing protein [Candidatus Limnocylindrales bacterium]|nr:SH3 domain-containing protein [Candidatus Limnocylindrales bacterium]
MARIVTPKRVLMLVVFAALLMMALPVFAQEPVASVRTGAANLRTGPGFNYGSVGALPFGFGVRMVGRSSDNQWIFVNQTNGVNGWMSIHVLYTAYPVINLPITDSAQGTQITPFATVSTGVANVRATPDPVGAIVTTLPINTRVDLLGRNHNGTWAQVRWSGGTGWMAASTLTSSAPIRSLAPTDGSVYAPVTTPPTTGGTSTGGCRLYYTVVRGDSLANIAARYGTTVWAIAQYNASLIANVNYIQAGWRLCIP